MPIKFFFRYTNSCLCLLASVLQARIAKCLRLLGAKVWTCHEGDSFTGFQPPNDLVHGDCGLCSSIGSVSSHWFVILRLCPGCGPRLHFLLNIAQRDRISKIVQRLIFFIFFAKWKYAKTKLNFRVFSYTKMKLTSLVAPRGTQIQLFYVLVIFMLQNS